MRVPQHPLPRTAAPQFFRSGDSFALFQLLCPQLFFTVDGLQTLAVFFLPRRRLFFQLDFLTDFGKRLKGFQSRIFVGNAFAHKRRLDFRHFLGRRVVVTLFAEGNVSRIVGNGIRPPPLQLFHLGHGGLHFCRVVLRFPGKIGNPVRRLARRRLQIRHLAVQSVLLQLQIRADGFRLLVFLSQL